MHAQPFSRFDTIFESIDTEDDPSVSADRSLTRDRVRHALARLKPEEREILILRDFDGHSYAQISELLECPAGTVMSRLYYARKHVKDFLEDES